jgi:hypothetical protein
VYSGYITLRSTSGRSDLIVPYLGVVGSMRSTPVLRAANVYLAKYYGAVPANTTYTIPRPDAANPPPTDKGDDAATPNVYISATLGAKVVRVEVLSGDAVLGELAGWPRMHSARGEMRAWFHGLLVDGRVVGEGSVAMRVKALRVFGNEAVEADWDVVKTVEFGLKYT